MEEVRLVDIREEILSDNDDLAAALREQMKNNGVFLVNLMASPGAGKTSLILKTIEKLSKRYRIGIIEGDIDSIVDAQKVSSLGVPAVQLRTGGVCHLDAAMIEAAMKQLDLDSIDLLIVENIGNLVCPAEFDIGANVRVMISSVPEGDDKVLKYPLMFSICDALVVNKVDYLPDPGFDVGVFWQRVHNLNPSIHGFELSCRTEQGVDAWIDWLAGEIARAGIQENVKLSVINNCEC